MRYEEKLIQLAYELILEPSKLIELDELLDRKIHPELKNDEGFLSGEDPSLLGVSQYFENAYELSRDRTAFKTSKAGIATRTETQIWFLIDDVGTVTRLSEAAMAHLDLKSGQSFLDILAGLSDRETFSASIGASQSDSPSAVTVFSLVETATDRIQRYVLEWEERGTEARIGVVQKLNSIWDNQVGRLFAQSLGLTSIEQALCRAIITNTSLRSLADQRRRSIGTVRNQLKRMLSKLNLSSQSELICLYAGFSKFHQLDHMQGNRAFEQDLKRKLQVIDLSCGNKLAFDVWGEQTADPILYIHPLIGGTGLTEKVKAEFGQHNYKFLMPWRPGYGATSRLSKGNQNLHDFSDMLAELLDRLEIQQCPVLASNGALPYAIAFAHKYPERCSRIILAAPAIPLTVNKQFSMMSMQLRVAAYLAKHSESVFRQYLRSTLSAIEGGYEEDFARHFFEKSKADQVTSTGSEFRKLFVDAYSYSFINGFDGAFNDFVFNRGNWMQEFGDLPHPIHMIFGDDDPQHTLPLVKSFAGKFKNTSFEIVPGAGSLVFFQAPERFVRAMKRTDA